MHFSSFSLPGESIWLDIEVISGMIKFCKNLFPVVSYAFNGVPTYTSGSIGYIICGMEKVFLLESCEVQCHF